MTAARFRLGVFAVWTLACAILLFIAWSNVATLTMLDADDYLRLQEVRDWLGGQGFHDVTQYRIDPPHGVPMHWSRIVDFPLAGLLLLLEPLLGSGLAERVTVAAVPLITLGGTLCAIALASARLADHRAAMLAVMLAATAPPLLFHLMPTRIDHHGWQTMLGLFAVAALFDRRAARGGFVAGISAALWLAISLEGLPIVVAIGGLLALRFLLDGEGRGSALRFSAFAASWAVVGIALFVVFHAPDAYARAYCDAVSPAWFGPMIAAPALAALLLPLTVRRGPLARGAVLIATGGVGLALLAVTAPACLDGPFSALDPVVRHFWYKNVAEGLPVWEQSANNAALVIGFPLIGIAGSLLGWQRATTTEAARNWLTMLLLLLAAYVVSLFVQRASGFAHGCALPGAAMLLARLLDRIARWQPLPRTLASAAAILALSPIGATAAGWLVLPYDANQRGEAERIEAEAKTCQPSCERFAALAKLPPAYILTGIDLTPRLLVNTPHRYAGSGHHRNPRAIRRVIDAFTGEPEVAHRMMVTRGMDYVLIDSLGSEAAIYIRAAPGGLMARLVAGRPPSWLTPVPLPGSPLKLWRRTG